MAELLPNNALPSNARLAAAIMRATVTQVLPHSSARPSRTMRCNRSSMMFVFTLRVRLSLRSLHTIRRTLELELVPAATVPLVSLAFKLEDGRFGQLTYMHVYQGSLRKSQFIFHTLSGKRIKVPELVHMYSNEMEMCHRVHVVTWMWGSEGTF